MIDYKDACRIAIENAKTKDVPFDYQICTIIDCVDFYNIGFAYFEKITGKKLKFSHPILMVDISKDDGHILPLRVYLPGTEYGNIINAGIEIEVPQEFQQRNNV